MRIARFTHNDVPQYAFVQTDKNDGKDYLVALNGYPLSGQAVEPTGERYPVDGDGIRLLAPVIPSKVYGLAKNYEAHAQFMHEAGHAGYQACAGGYGDFHQAEHVGDWSG